jgi:hypothetical protein
MARILSPTPTPDMSDQGIGAAVNCFVGVGLPVDCGYTAR